MVERLAPALGGGDSNMQVLLYLVLADKVLKAVGTQAGIQYRVFFLWLPRYYAVYLSPPLRC
jgi:hypothetical protein